MAFTHTMVINIVGQLARGTTFTYELRLRKFLHCWKGLGVKNIADDFIVGFGP
jgi:hypothetical protein